DSALHAGGGGAAAVKEPRLRQRPAGAGCPAGADCPSAAAWHLAAELGHGDLQRRPAAPAWRGRGRRGRTSRARRTRRPPRHQHPARPAGLRRRSRARPDRGGGAWALPHGGRPPRPHDRRRARRPVAGMGSPADPLDRHQRGLEGHPDPDRSVLPGLHDGVPRAAPRRPEPRRGRSGLRTHRVPAPHHRPTARHYPGGVLRTAPCPGPVLAVPRRRRTYRGLDGPGLAAERFAEQRQGRPDLPGHCAPRRPRQNHRRASGPRPALGGAAVGV
ncbi:MAG: Alkanesulfonates transport system permease protein, partial [uncultured Arthrobacter sp.]